MYLYIHAQNTFSSNRGNQLSYLSLTEILFQVHLGFPSIHLSILSFKTLQNRWVQRDREKEREREKEIEREKKKDRETEKIERERKTERE